ncbi:MAG: helix-turn-helix transcriptional regulator [Chloroflexi bacterium]|nr:helix-turn-helix transcriptional regulator [Chloroflexota bacterium]
MVAEVPQAEITIRDLDTLKILVDAKRWDILRHFVDRPRTVRQVAKVMDTSAHRLYYHVRLLVRYGLLVPVRKTLTAGNIVYHYQVSAYRFIVDPDLLVLDSSANGRGLQEAHGDD